VLGVPGQIEPELRVLFGETDRDQRHALQVRRSDLVELGITVVDREAPALFYGELQLFEVRHRTWRWVEDAHPAAEPAHKLAIEADVLSGASQVTNAVLRQLGVRRNDPSSIGRPEPDERARRRERRWIDTRHQGRLVSRRRLTRAR